MHDTVADVPTLAFQSREGWASALLLLPGAAVARRTVPLGFFGVVASTELTNRPSLVSPETSFMAKSGVESERATFYWSVAQPHATDADIPASSTSHYVDEHGIPTNWATFDRIVAAAARNHISLLPEVLDAPPWASADYPPSFRILTPADPATFALFMTTLVERYGPHGTFWSENPALPKTPVHSWQIWNEPHLPYYWRDTKDRPWQTTYLATLKAASQAVHAADPGARVVLGGLTYFSWKILPMLYKAGAARWFDVAAIHPYSLQAANVIKILALDRAAMRHAGDGKTPIWVTETSWPSAKGRTKITYGYNVTRKGQARKVSEALRLYAKNRRRLGLGHVYWYKWLSYDSGTSDPFDYSGLRALSGGKPTSKPSYAAFRHTALSLEGR